MRRQLRLVRGHLQVVGEGSLMVGEGSFAGGG